VQHASLINSLTMATHSAQAKARAGKSRAKRLKKRSTKQGKPLLHQNIHAPRSGFGMPEQLKKTQLRKELGKKKGC
jgi:hypothetical protein